MTFIVNVLLTCIQNCDARLFCDYYLQVHIQWVDSYHGYHIYPRTFLFGDTVALLQESYSFSREILLFLAAIWTYF